MPAASKAPRRARAAGKLPVRHIGPQSGPHAGTTAGGEQCPWDAAGFDFNRMKQAVSYTQKLKKNGAATLLSRVEVFEYACVDQETIISYDPRRFAERPDGPSTALPDLPDIAWSDDLLYFYRQASQRAAHEALGADSPYAEDPHAQLRDRVVGRLLRAWPNIEARLASPEEVQAAPNFSHCTVPLVVSAFWPNTLCEFFARVPGAFHYHQQAGNLSPNMTIVLVNPLKLAPARFNYDIMRAFSSLEPISFAELSARHPPSTPSRSTFEGTHVRCFRHLVVWKANQDNFRGRLPTVGKAVAAYYSSQLRRSPPFWLSLRPPRPGVMRILFEQRNVGNARMLIGFDSLLRACAASKRPFGGSSWRRLHASGNAPGADDWRRGWGGRPASVECQSYALGSRPFVQDLAVLQETDVLVATHGYFWWGVMIKDPALVRSPWLMTEAGMYADWRTSWKSLMFKQRDQDVELRWPPLHAVLTEVARVGRNKEQYGALRGKNQQYFSSTVFEVLPDGILRRHKGLHQGKASADPDELATRYARANCSSRAGDGLCRSLAVSELWPVTVAALFGGGQAIFIAIQCLDVSVASLGSWAALAAVVSASLTSLLSKRAPGPPPSISEFDVAPAVARAVKILNLAAALLHRVRSGDAALTLRLGLSLWLGAHLLRPFSLFTLAWAAFTAAAGLPLVPNHREKVDEARAAIAAAAVAWAALARAKAKYAAALAALTIWYRLSWTSMGLATLFGGLALHLSSEENVAFSQTVASVVAGAQRKARRMTMTAQSLGLFSPSKERSE
ncbi:hypothetical protein EMIHUDRAFT_115893 [Emiliania huxleyi CCMP1516]|uniref:Reticulon domain-containing protein n=2 Tax=Emiliania huxleyi TaxID=2903 RepID=A0A0D3JLQ3_EMIH1|nr:hypothetical protein EMIHUDRAFT_115893 [Emiliania huxleyi CCMP1516]EOD24438.1 hypothetical protein EMIHUDRAFT_115893 [Emiliania huxleyi CCMP1516]|eukprot:XP_005776867.1 hypothetical protein EMIHUDRAFT_115893 [Emiliania huxleyi CCMP1516]